MVGTRKTAMFGQPKPLKVVLLGGPASGKTTLLTALWILADPEALPEDVNAEFAVQRDSLNGVGRPQEAIHATPLTPSLPPSILFYVHYQEHEILVETFDYAGEKSLAFFADSEDDFKMRLADSDAVLLLVDSYALCRSASWQAWVAEAGVDFLFRWLRDVLSDRHDGGMPFEVVCTRSDLAPPELLESRKAEIRESLSAYKLNAEVTPLTAFGRHLAEEAVPTMDEDALPSGFLLPAEAVHGCPAFVEVLARMQQQHSKTVKHNHVHSALGVGAILVVVALLLGWVGKYLFEQKGVVIQPSTTTGKGDGPSSGPIVVDSSKPDELRKQFAARLKATLPLRLPQLGKALMDGLRRQDGARQIWQEMYLRKLQEVLPDLLPSLQYNTREATWQEPETDEFIRHCEAQFRQAGLSDQLEKLRCARIAVLQEAATAELGLDEAQGLIREFRQWNGPPPGELIRRTQEGAAQKLEGGLQAAIREAESPQDLYKTRIPELVKGTRSYEIGETFARQLDELEKYCTRVCEKKELKPTLVAYRREGDRNENLDIKVLIKHEGGTVSIPGEGTTGDFDGDFEFRPKDHGKLDMSLGWEFDKPYEIVITDYDGPNDEFVRWSSDSLSGPLVRLGYRLPGLTFMLFRDCSRYWKPGKAGSWPSDYSDVQSRLEWSFGPELEALINPPKILVNANRDR